MVTFRAATNGGQQVAEYLVATTLPNSGALLSTPRVRSFGGGFGGAGGAGSGAGGAGGGSSRFPGAGVQDLDRGTDSRATIASPFQRPLQWALERGYDAFN